MIPQNTFLQGNFMNDFNTILPRNCTPLKGGPAFCGVPIFGVRGELQPQETHPGAPGEDLDPSRQVGNAD